MNIDQEATSVLPGMDNFTWYEGVKGTVSVISSAYKKQWRNSEKITLFEQEKLRYLSHLLSDEGFKGGAFKIGYCHLCTDVTYNYAYSPFKPEF